MKLPRCSWVAGDELAARYHDFEYGVRVTQDSAILERLALEIFQAGLNWRLILHRRSAIRHAFGGFDLHRVAEYGPEDVARLLTSEGVIRNRRKIEAIIHNAGVMVRLAAEHGSVLAWLDGSAHLDLDGWIRLMRRTFRFTGPEITREFLTSLGYLPVVHDPHCFMAAGPSGSSPGGSKS